jgi:hypothetical protein
MDPERPIEMLLRKAAEARRAQAGAPQELHPANRRMLQSEVARKFAAGAPQKRSFLDSLIFFMPRLAWGAVVLVGLGLAASLMLPRQNERPQEMFFAKNGRAPSVQTANEAKQATAVASKLNAQSEAPALGRADDLGHSVTMTTNMDLAQLDREKDSLSGERRKGETQKEQSKLALNPPASEPAAISGSLALAKQKEEVVNAPTAATPPPATPVPQENMLRRSYGLAAPAQAPSSSAVSTVSAGLAASTPAQSRDESAKTELAYKSLPQETTATARALQLKTATVADDVKRRPAPIARVSQQYVQFDLAKKNPELELADKVPVAKPILASFELQQVGREIRIVDSDGSIYSGSFLSPQTFSYQDSGSAQQSAAAGSRQVTERQTEHKNAFYDSRLQLNLTYGFRVAGTNQSRNQMVIFTGQILAPTNDVTLSDESATVNGNRVAPPELSPLPLLNSRISGKVVIGTNKEVEVNAIPAH